MSQKISLKEAERKAFSATINDGLWDIFLGCFFLIFVFAPFLSASLGDFWSSFVFLPFWALVYLGIRLLRMFVVAPRIGFVSLGQGRKTKIKKFTVVMLVVNAIALILGLVAAVSFGKMPGLVYSFGLGLVFLVGFSLAAYLLDFPRLYVYGLLLGMSPLVGEWLWSQGYASHHGFPITFGISACIMILTGLVVFIRLLIDNPLPKEGLPPQEV